MLSWIHEGKDLMIIKKLDTNLKKYDSVFFKRPEVTGRGEYVLHRVMKDYGNGTYYIIGDNTRSGEIVKRGNIYGILESIKQPNKKQLMLKMKIIFLKLNFGIYLFGQSSITPNGVWKK